MKTRKATTEKESSDFIEHLFTASTHDYLMFFTNTGRVYVERVHEIPDLGRASKGRSIANVLELKHGEKISDVIRVKAVYGKNKEDITWRQEHYIFFSTRNGTVKKTANLLSQYRLITLTDCQRAAHGRYHNAIAATANIPAAPFQLKALDPANNQADKAMSWCLSMLMIALFSVETGIQLIYSSNH